MDLYNAVLDAPMAKGIGSIYVCYINSALIYYKSSARTAMLDTKDRSA